MLVRSLTFMGITGTSALSLSATSTAADVVSRYRPSLPSYVARGGVAVVTGGNSGIGAESAKALLDAGCFVVLACRDEAAGERALSEMGAAAGCARVQKLDLADLDSVSAACSEIAAKEGRVSLLLNNAGVMATPQEKTKQGFELQIGTNHLGHFALTRLLLPLIEDDGRVVTVASTAHTMGSVDTGDLNFATGDRKYSPWGAYGQSKAANILFAKGLADQLKEAGSNVLSVSLHPGVRLAASPPSCPHLSPPACTLTPTPALPLPTVSRTPLAPPLAPPLVLPLAR